MLLILCARIVKPINGKQAPANVSARACGRQLDYSPALAEFVRDNAPTTATAPPGGNYNFSDLLRSSFALDNLSPAYRTYLFAMVNRPLTGAEITEQNRRDDLGATFTRVYTHRQLTCLACHTTTNSTTGPQTFWNRHFPIRGQFSTALFGAPTGRPSDEVHAMLRTDVAAVSRPWGIEGCGSFVAQASVPNDPLTSPISGAPLEAYFTGPQGRRGSVWQLENTLHSGYDNLVANGLRRSRPAGTSGARCDLLFECIHLSERLNHAGSAARRRRYRQRERCSGSASDGEVLQLS